MKKNIYLLAVLGTLIAGCFGETDSNISISGSNISSYDSNTSPSSSISENLQNTDFSFSDLRLNLGSIIEIGVKKTSGPLGRKQSSITNQTSPNESYLVGYNAQGEEMPIVYLNSQDQEVQVPFSVFSFEVIGDFSYIVYYNSNVTTGLSSLESTLYYDYGPGGVFQSSPGKYLGMTNFEILLKTYGPNTEGNPGTHAFIISHNESGKLFDAVNALSLNYFDDGNMQYTVDLRLLTLMEDKIVYFKSSFPVTNTCRGELVFNSLNRTLTKTEICTSLDIKPIFTHTSGYFVYTLNNKVNFASPDFSSTGDLTNYFGGNIPQRNMVFKSVGNTIVMIKISEPSFFVILDSNFQLIEAKSEPLYYGEVLNSVNWLFNKDGFDYFDSNSRIHYVNFETFEYGVIEFNQQFPPLQQYGSQYKYLIYEGNLYQIATKIQSLQGNNSFITLEYDIFEVKSDFTKTLKEGYIEYSQVSGLTQINKYLNLQTGEIFLESESRPTITVTQVQPIN